MIAATRYRAVPLPRFTGMDPNFGDFWWRQYVALSGPQCAYCLREVPWAKLSRDHIIPRCKGGSDGPENIVPVCRSCNQKKGKMSLRGFVINGRRCCPEKDAKPHALGELRKGRWVWSEAALRVQAEHQERLRCVSATLHAFPLGMKMAAYPLAADIQASLSWAHGYKPIEVVDPPAPQPKGIGPLWLRQYIDASEGRCCLCNEEVKQWANIKLDLKERKVARNVIPTCARCSSRRGKIMTLGALALYRRPPLQSQPHPLGALVGDVWVWSDIARKIQAEYDERSPLELAAAA